MSEINQNRMTRKSLWTVSGIYALIALEFVYMATPFAAFFYSIYSPVLNFINRYQSLAWLDSTFLPHIVQDTTSSLLNLRAPAGIALFVTGLVGFIIGAGQVYYAKLFSKRAVLHGLYRFIRHPQYLFLMVWGLGLVLLWPRTVVLLSFVTMLFIYYHLARIEEQECECKFGQSYRQYKEKTGMFIPAKLIPHITFTRITLSKPIQRLLSLIFYLITIAVVIYFSGVARTWSINQLYAIYTADAACISITKIDEQTMHDIIDCAMADKVVQRRLSPNSGSPEIKYINYILPANLFMLEIPMNEPENSTAVHFLPVKQSTEKVKIVFTRAEMRVKRDVQIRDKEILKHVAGRIPVMEVYIDLVQKNIIEIKDPPVQASLKDITMPVF
jgi:protein-S-isoprenylcysteine O-methyltransferase Ste14